MPAEARANGLWRGPDPPEIAELTYSEAKVINLARVYVSVKRVFLDRSSYAATTTAEAPLYHQKNVVAYPMSPDAALTAIGVSPSALAKTLLVQFVGDDSERLRRHPDLQVSVENLRDAFRWLSSNNWNFMEATRHHPAWGDSGLIEKPLQDLLDAYSKSVGGNSGVPRELIVAATPVSAAKASVQAEGPADCTSEKEAGPRDNEPEEAENAAVVNGGLGDVGPIQLWTQVLRNFRVAQRLEEEIAALAGAAPSARADKKREHSEKFAEAVDGLQRLTNWKVKEKLDEWASSERNDRPTLKISHEDKFLSSRTPNFWASCFVRLFPRGDCQETCPQRPTRLPSDRWAKCLLTRADTGCWRSDVEFVASVFNVFLRRDQMSKVEAHVRHTTDGAAAAMTLEQTRKLATVTAEGLVSSAIATGDASSVRDALRKQGLDHVVRNALQKMQLVLRRVRGSSEERDAIRWKFRALRIWSGCSSLFFTLNPHDIRSPLTVLLVQGDAETRRPFSLEMTEAEADQWTKDFCADNPRRLHALVAQDPLVAARVFHWTVRLVVRTLFNCSDGPKNLHPDGVAAREAPGVFGHVRAYLGVVEEQLRKALHIHMLVQLVGFAHPEDLFKNDRLASTFRRLWYYVASVTFRSTEAFVNYLDTPAATAALATLPLLPLTKSQREKIGSARSAESNNAQTAARGLDVPPARSGDVPALPFFPGEYLGDTGMSSDDWGSRVATDTFSRTRKMGNHVCKPSVCYKGRLGKRGFCRMYYWHWAKIKDPKTKKLVPKRQHGLQLQPRWDGTGAPPLLRHPPHIGLPALETTHPFHFKLSPGMLLGPQCNHDLAVLLRLCDLPEDAPDAKLDEDHVAVVKAAMVEAMGDHEFYPGAFGERRHRAHAAAQQGTAQTRNIDLRIGGKHVVCARTSARPPCVL